ncbi:MAG: hypothetical protein CMA96_02795 [Euryarchaeota archaeon]|nr:hypothetical protein [Euryarchaeota archaeon]|tara:strand:+ start:3577 stop:4872 length:1296 start_codon:yes stop_codon:yes gene_type:complete
MVDFSYPHSATAGTAIEASKHNDNWNEVKNFINGDAGNPSTYPGLLRAVNPSATGTLTATGTVSLGATNHLYLNSTQHSVIGLSTGTDINAQTAGSFLKDLNYRANFTSSGPGNNTHQLSMGSDVASGADAGNYLTESHRYSVYSRRAGDGWSPGGGAAHPGRPSSEYRLVINGSMAIRGDIIGYSAFNESVPGTSTDYLEGEGTRINCQWLNVAANVDVNGYIRVMTKYDYARLFMGNDYDHPGEDWLEWNDDIHSSQPGFAFHINGTSATNMSGRILSISKDSSNYVDVRAPVGTYPANQPTTTTAGWPSISGSPAHIDTSTQRLGVNTSSIRFKEDVEDLGTEENWDKLRSLKPRTFRWNREVADRSSLDYETQIPEPGFIAEEVHEVAPDMTLYDAEGDPIVYREKSMLAMLVKAVQDIDERLGALE